MRSEIVSLRQVMEKEGISAWICPSSDAHSSEYLSEYDKERAFLSGFTGSAGTLLVLKDKAFLWTDGRYFVQAKKELKDSGIELMKSGEEGVPSILSFLCSELKYGDVLGFSAKLINTKQALEYRCELEKRGIILKVQKDIVEEIWENRPDRSKNPVFVLGTEFSGESVDSKLSRFREKLKENKANASLITNLSDIAWFTNMRGSDIECNPQYLSYMYVSLEKAVLFMQKAVLTDDIKIHLEAAKIELEDYDSYYDFIKNIVDKDLLLDNNECNYQSYILVSTNNNILFAPSIITMFKNIKNETEIKMTKNAHIRDGVYETRFIRWLRDSLNKGEEITELSAALYLDELRSSDLKYLSLSFETISAYGANAAMPHYTATTESFSKLERKGLYLVDSGATYMDGTTDVTRTMALGDITEEERLHYTLATMGMLRLMNAKFPKGAKGYNLDTLARSAMWEYGLDYNHGTGHGVGFCNGVHEGPISIRYRVNPDLRLDMGFEAGMIVSDEPGVYIAGSHGVRCENLLLSIEAGENFLAFEPLTMIPLDPRALDLSIMSKKDIEYFNAYQALVYEKLELYLDEEEKAWLKDETKPLEV